MNKYNLLTNINIATTHRINILHQKEKLVTYNHDSCCETIVILTPHLPKVIRYNIATHHLP